MLIGMIVVRYGIYAVVPPSANDERVTEVDKFIRITEDNDIRVIEKEVAPNNFLLLSGNNFLLLDGTNFNLL